MRMRWLLAGTMMAMGMMATAMPVMAEPQQQRPTPPAAAPAPQAGGDLTLDQVFGAPLLGSAGGGERFSPDGSMLLFRRPGADGRMNLWSRDIATGTERMLVDAASISTGGALSEEERMQRERRRVGGASGILDYQLSADGRTLLVPLDGQLYLAEIGGATRAVTQGEGAKLNPVLSPRGRYVSYVRDQNLYAVDLQANRTMQLTQDGAGTIRWGEAEFVAQEEMSRFTGYWWSPNDDRVAVQRFDESPVEVITRTAIGADTTTTYDQRYPLAGTDNVVSELYVMDPSGSNRVKVDLGSNTDIYLARVDWAPDGRTLYVQRQSRDQKTLDMLSVDPATGRSRVLFTERAGNRSWVDLSDAYRFMDDGSIVWWSQRDGWAHLYRFNRGRWTQLTRGQWEVADIVGYDEQANRLFFTGNRDNPLERQLYAIDLARPRTVTRVTEAGFVNAVTMDDTGRRMIVTRSSPTQPTQSYLADASGQRIAWLNENRIVPGHPYHPYLASHRPSTFGTLKAADGRTDLHWRMITPVLEPGRRYPVFFSHYGGPTVQVVQNNFGSLLHQYLVDKGWIVFQVDNRGSANRGKAFLDTLYHAMGAVEVEDQLAGAEWLKQQPFVDPDRIATYGWSYGGYLTLKMLAANPGVYAAGVAGAPVTQWGLYDTHYTERYLGDPRRVPDVYIQSDVTPEAAKITDPMLLIHGMSDDNVFLTNATALAAAMQENAQPFEMMLYPGQAHGVGGRGISQHLWRTIENFLQRHVLDKPTATP